MAYLFIVFHLSARISISKLNLLIIQLSKEKIVLIFFQSEVINSLYSEGKQREDASLGTA